MVGVELRQAAANLAGLLAHQRTRRIIEVDDSAMGNDHHDGAVGLIECRAGALGIDGLRGDVERELHDAARLARAVEHRIVRGLRAHFAACLGDALEQAGAELSAAQSSPEFVVLDAVAVSRSSSSA